MGVLMRFLNRDDLNNAASDNGRLWLIAQDVLLRSGVERAKVSQIIGISAAVSKLTNTTTGTAAHGIKMLSREVLASFNNGNNNVSNLNLRQAERIFGQIGANALSSPFWTSSYEGGDVDFRTKSLDKGKELANRIIPTNSRHYWDQKVEAALEFYGQGAVKRTARSVAGSVGNFASSLMPFTLDGKKGIGSFDFEDLQADFGLCCK